MVKQTSDIAPLFDAATLADRVGQMGRTITQDYANRTPLVLLGVLRGAFVFLADLCRSIDLPLTIEFIATESYGDATQSSGVVKLLSDLRQTVRDKHVILVEDIVDTGLTAQYLVQNLQTREPASIAVCTLLDKPSCRQTLVDIDYCGFTVPNTFVVGYGLDHAQEFRNLPFIGHYPNN